MRNILQNNGFLNHHFGDCTCGIGCCLLSLSSISSIFGILQILFIHRLQKWKSFEYFLSSWRSWTKYNKISWRNNIEFISKFNQSHFKTHPAQDSKIDKRVPVVLTSSSSTNSSSTSSSSGFHSHSQSRGTT